MEDLFNLSFSSYGIIPTTLFLFVAVYWLIVLLGLIDIDFIDIEIDAEIEIEASSDSTSQNISWINSILLFFNLNYLPLMIFMSFLAVPFWLFSIWSYYFLPLNFGFLSYFMLIPNFILSLFIAKYLSLPIARIFKRINEEHESVNPVGQICEIVLPISLGKYGQAVINQKGNNIRITVASTQDNMNKGDKALVISYNQEEKIYIVEPYY